MKTITSAGGPYIIINQASPHLWGANEAKTFCSPTSPFPDDYEAAGDLTAGRSHPPRLIAKVDGGRDLALLISMPFEISIALATSSCIYLGQAEYADPEWSLATAGLDIFANADFDEYVNFDSNDATFTVFDSACLPREIGQECLMFNLARGQYKLSAAMHEPDQRTSLLLYKIEPVVS